jgi:Flp pilus assembly protein TadD
VLRKAILVAPLVVALAGCFISRTKEREVTTPRSARACGTEVCNADEQCVQGMNGAFHCE